MRDNSTLEKSPYVEEGLESPSLKSDQDSVTLIPRPTSDPRDPLVSRKRPEIRANANRFITELVSGQEVHDSFSFSFVCFCCVFGSPGWPSKCQATGKALSQRDDSDHVFCRSYCVTISRGQAYLHILRDQLLKQAWRLVGCFSILFAIN